MDSPKNKITIVEDDEAILEMYKIKLQRAGFEVSTAKDGQAGLTLCQQVTPDLLLLDLGLPIMSGSEMLKKLRETDWGADIRVIILTNSSKAEAPTDLQFLHVDRYVVKAHHTPSQVLEIIQEVLGIKTTPKG